MTSPEKYRTHRCHIKSTRNKHFTDAVNFSHKKLTRPTTTHAEKVMAAIEDCAKSIINLGNGNGYEETKQLVQITYRAIQNKKSIAATPTTTKFEPTRLRVPLIINNINTRQTRSMIQPTQQLTTISTPAVPRMEQSTVAKNKTEKRGINL